jgi:hypothetical protein
MYTQTAPQLTSTIVRVEGQHTLYGDNTVDKRDITARYLLAATLLRNIQRQLYHTFVNSATRLQGFPLPAVRAKLLINSWDQQI